MGRSFNLKGYRGCSLWRYKKKFGMGKKSEKAAAGNKVLAPEDIVRDVVNE